MASVRSMLRNERANRRVCHIQIKTEALWAKHLESSQHSSSLQKSRGATSAAPSLLDHANKGNGSKKRKADDDSSDDDTRKRTRGAFETSSPGGEAHGASLADRMQTDAKLMHNRKRKPSIEIEAGQPEPPLDADPKTNGVPSDSLKREPVRPKPIDEDEWAAFQREVASPPPETSALTAAADINAAPMTAAELAAQSRKQASKQAKEQMEAEIEGEKEDAARQMEEEFEEMVELEDRVRRLREKRERLRVKDRGGGGEAIDVDEEKVPPDEVMKNECTSEDMGSDDDEDEWGSWRR
ncbi:MAG: hypothetical protein Q9166_000126 [cf. Caloplaca sp. 2 TL-2023]